MSKRWYVVHAYSGYEKQVMKALQERISLSGLEEKFGEILAFDHHEIFVLVWLSLVCLPLVYLLPFSYPLSRFLLLQFPLSFPQEVTPELSMQIQRCWSNSKIWKSV